MSHYCPSNIKFGEWIILVKEWGPMSNFMGQRGEGRIYFASHTFHEIYILAITQWYNEMAFKLTGQDSLLIVNLIW